VKQSDATKQGQKTNKDAETHQHMIWKENKVVNDETNRRSEERLRWKSELCLPSAQLTASKWLFSDHSPCFYG
jgi:hypothetical protein